jgi:hypothetical protein
MTDLQETKVLFKKSQNTILTQTASKEMADGFYSK